MTSSQDGKATATYHELQREWTTDSSEVHEMTRTPTQPMASVMVDRWFHESMREQPYHTIHTVVQSEDVGKDVAVQPQPTSACAIGSTSGGMGA